MQRAPILLVFRLARRKLHHSIHATLATIGVSRLFGGFATRLPLIMRPAWMRRPEEQMRAALAWID